MHFHFPHYLKIVKYYIYILYIVHIHTYYIQYIPYIYVYFINVYKNIYMFNNIYTDNLYKIYMYTKKITDRHISFHKCLYIFFVENGKNDEIPLLEKKKNKNISECIHKRSKDPLFLFPFFFSFTCLFYSFFLYIFICYYIIHFFFF